MSFVRILELPQIFFRGSSGGTDEEMVGDTNTRREETNSVSTAPFLGVA